MEDGRESRRGIGRGGGRMGAWRIPEKNNRKGEDERKRGKKGARKEGGEEYGYKTGEKKAMEERG